jgi:putative CocE/NonD family hydrolase
MFNPYPIKKETASFITKDGISLAADIYRPDSREFFPILLMRQPYGKAIASTVVYAHPSWYARQGYIVVIQDVRGRGNSTGNFNLFAHEISDGLETIEWVLTIPNNTGVVGMYGFSYQGMTQLYAATNGHAALKTICPGMIAHDLYRDWGYENEAFNFQYNLAWAIQLAAETARLKGDETAYQKLWVASRNLPLFDPIAASPQILQDLAADSFYHDWITRYLPDDYWQNLSPQNLLKNIDLPMLHIGGWFDPHLRGTLGLYQEMQARSIYPQQLIIGAWTHLPWGRKVGEIDYGQEAISPVDKMQLQWFDYFLKGQETELLKNPPMYLFQMGSNQWRYLEKFPRENQQIYYLASQGLANLREDEGKLSAILLEPAIEDTIVHDPWRPVPSLGGHSALPGGIFDRTMLDCRSDVITYTSPLLEKDLTILGSPRLDCYCQADAVSFDICAVVSQVTPDGRVFNITQGYKRVNNPESPLNIAMQATFITIPQGHSLRLSLSASCFPAHPVNAGTGSYPHQSRAIDFSIITIKVFCQGNFPAKLLLPLVGES